MKAFQRLSLIAASVLSNGFDIREKTLDNGFNIPIFKAKSKFKKTLKRKRRMSAKQKVRFRKKFNKSAKADLLKFFSKKLKFKNKGINNETKPI